MIIYIAMLCNSLTTGEYGEKDNWFDDITSTEAWKSSSLSLPLGPILEPLWSSPQLGSSENTGCTSGRVRTSQRQIACKIWTLISHLINGSKSEKRKPESNQDEGVRENTGTMKPKIKLRKTDCIKIRHLKSSAQVISMTYIKNNMVLMKLASKATHWGTIGLIPESDVDFTQA